MNDHSDVVNAAFARVVTRTWRFVWLNLLMATLAVGSLATSVHHGTFSSTDALLGVVIALAGLQLWIADGQFTRLGSARPHRWVRPLAVVFLVVGAGCFAFGVRALLLRLTAS